MVWTCAFSTGLIFVNLSLNLSVSGCAFEVGIELQVLGARKIAGIRAGVSFCCYTILKSPKKDETAVYGCKSWLVSSSYSYWFTDKFLFCVGNQSFNH